MLRAMRGATKTWAIKLFLLFLVLSFAIWGVGDMFRGNPQQRLVACIGGLYPPFTAFFGSNATICTGKKITAEMLETEFRRAYEVQRKKNGQEYTLKAARQQGLMTETLKSMTHRILFNGVADALGLRFDDAFVMKQIAAVPGMLTPDGRIKADLFDRLLRETHMTQGELLDYTRDTVQRDLLLATMLDIANPPQYAAAQLLAAQGQARELQALRLANDAMDAPTAPDDAELHAFYDAHTAQFTAPEYRSVSVLQLALEDLSKRTVITDQDLTTAYDKRKSEFAIPERRDLVQVVLPDENKAKQFLDQAKTSGGVKLAALQQKLKVVTLDDQSEQNIFPAFYTSVFTADAGALIGPIKTDFGWHVIQVLNIKPASQPPLDDVRATLRGRMQQERAADEIQNLANKVDDALAGGKNLEEISETYQLKFARFPAIDAGGAIESGTSAGLPSPDLILSQAFGLTEGETSSLLDDRKGNYLVLHVDKITPSHVRALATIRDKVVTAWRANRQNKAAAAKIRELADAWQKDSNALAALANQKGVSIVQVKPVSRLTGFDKALPSSMEKTVFALKPGDVAIGADNVAQYAVRVANFKPFDPSGNSAAQAGLKAELTQKWRGNMLEEYVKQLQQETPVNINQALLRELETPARDE